MGFCSPTALINFHNNSTRISSTQMKAILQLRFMFIHAILLTNVRALDVSWIPMDADGDGPLPLSKNYRDKLRKLCTLINGPRPPPELVESKRGVILRKMCKRLERDDRKASSSSGGAAASPRLFFIGLVGVGITAYGLNNWPSIVRTVEHFIQQLFKPQERRRSNMWDEFANEQLREARMKRFASIQKED